MATSPRVTRYRPLPDEAYDPRVTDLSKPLNPVPGYDNGAFAPATGPTHGTSALVPGAMGGFVNRNISIQQYFQLTAGVSYRALGANVRRCGLQIQNRDATAALVYSLGTNRGYNGFLVSAGGSVLYDFTTPPDTLYLISTANILVSVLEVSRR